DRIAILVHGFAGKTGFMNEIEQCLTQSSFTNFYDEVINVSYYNSKYGLDFSRPFDLKTPIYDPETEQTLSTHFLSLIQSSIQDRQPPVCIDIFAHSMGGLVTRAMIKFLIPKKERNFHFSRVFLLGTPNHGTRLAKRIINIPTDLLLTGLNIALELPRGGVSMSDWQILKSQFIQMIPTSKFLKNLNKQLTNEEKAVKWYTVRGLNSYGLLESVWQPFLFRKFWLNRKFPFFHIGLIPNDGVVDAMSVPLKHAVNLTIPSATHMDLLKWNSKKSGILVRDLLTPIILSSS
ncbi:MAG: esterase/lipase family protein, partial [Candidatus Hodarchaeales archaeon]